MLISQQKYKSSNEIFLVLSGAIGLRLCYASGWHRFWWRAAIRRKGERAV